MRETKFLRSVAICSITLVLLGVWLVPCCFAVDAAEANAAIDQAESDLGSAYVAVVEAESVGADVFALLDTLNGAGDFLSKAYVAFRSGDYANANALAVNCGSAVEGVAEDAALLKMDAEEAYSDRFHFVVLESGVGLVLLVVIGLVGWVLLKRRYFKRALEMKPQVEEA
jgi:hypothetical protein